MKKLEMLFLKIKEVFVCTLKKHMKVQAAIARVGIISH